MFQAVRTRWAFQAAVEQIGDAIRGGDLRVGDRLPPERTLAEEMEISRPTLREAIRMLVDAAVIEVRPGPRGGAFVRSEFVPLELVAEHVELRAGEVSEVLEARRLLEPEVAKLAALRATDDDLARMDQTIALQRASAGDRNRFLQLDMRFHLAMARATANATVFALMKDLLRRLAIARDLAIRRQADGARAIAIHERTLAAVASGDPRLVEEAMDEHLRYLEQMWEEEGGHLRTRLVPQHDGFPTSALRRRPKTARSRAEAGLPGGKPLG